MSENVRKPYALTVLVVDGITLRGSPYCFVEILKISNNS
jgi:hypothetical protein